MGILVASFGVLIAGLGVLGLMGPGRFVSWVRSVWRHDLLWLAVAIRLVLGSVLLLAAPECRASAAVRVLGVISIAAAVSLPLVGSRRLRAFVDWWCRQSTGFIRVWMLAAVLFGGFLVYAGT
jgi:hypothetical protein